MPTFDSAITLLDVFDLQEVVFFIITNPFSDRHTIQVSHFFSLVIRILSLGGNPVTVDENVNAQAVNSQAFNGRNVTL